MSKTLSTIRDLSIVAGIYLYFMAWVYVHFYYEQFGISSASVQIEYAAYLVYAYNVVVSPGFIFFALLLLLLFFLIRALLRVKWAGRQLAQVGLSRFCWLLLLLLFFFPCIFYIARDAALRDYRRSRLNTAVFKTIQFVFNQDSFLLSPEVMLDSLLPGQHPLTRDIALLKNDTTQLLKLLGQSDAYYMVLNQPPYNHSLQLLPTGYVYYVNKKDVLLARIILRTTW